MDQDLAARVRGALIDARIVSGATDMSVSGASGYFGAPGSTPTLAQGLSAVLEVVALELVAATRTSTAWPEPARAAVVDAVDRTTRVLGAVKAPLLVAQEESGAWRAPGMRSFEAYRAKKNREDMGTARREASTARTLTELEGGLDALARGEITPSHAQRLQSVVDKVDPAVRVGLLTGPGAEHVRDLAKVHEPKVFERKVEQLAASAASPGEVQDAHEAIRARRYLRIMPGPGGTRIEGLLDPVAGYRFQLAIEAASPRPGKDDQRPLGQRNADALEAIAAAILAEGQLSRATHVPTQVTITMTQTTFLAAQNHLTTATHRARANREDTDHDNVDVAPFPLIRAQDGPLLPPADLGKLLCGSAVGRLVVSAEAVPLNVGRTQRTFKAHQRRTVELRDQHCAWPQCTQIARYCEIHHLDHWTADHGQTDVHRGILVCSYHHHELHTHDLDLIHTPPAEASAPSTDTPSTEMLRGVPRAGPPPLPGDPDYEPPHYEVVPRSHTANDRRTRLAQRLRDDTRARHDDRQAFSTSRTA